MFLKHYENPGKLTKGNLNVKRMLSDFFKCDVFIENIGPSKLIATLVSKELLLIIFEACCHFSFPNLGKKRVV